MLILPPFTKEQQDEIGLQVCSNCLNNKETDEKPYRSWFIDTCSRCGVEKKSVTIL